MVISAYLAIKYHADHRNRSLIETISQALSASGCECYCVARDLEQWGETHFTAHELMRRSFAAIDKSDFVLVELSEKGVGLDIEAGYAYARKIPVLTMAREGHDIPTTLQGISAQTFTYNDMTLI